MAVSGLIGLLLIYAVPAVSSYAITLRALWVAQREASAVAGTPNVRVNVSNGHSLSINVVNADLNGAPAEQRANRMRQIATAAYLGYTSRSQIQTVAVGLVRHLRHSVVLKYVRSDRRAEFRPFELIAEADLTEQWRQPDDLADHKVYLVAIGAVEPALN